MSQNNKAKTLINKLKAAPKYKLFLGGVLALITLLISFVFILFILVRVGAFGAIPSIEQLKKIENKKASIIYSADHEILGKYYIQNRTEVDYKQLSPYLINALVSTEDSRFFEHHGVDVRAILRVFFRTILMNDRSSGGGSTLSQQLVKNLIPRKKYGFLTIPVIKFREMIIARRLEKLYSKEELLNLYLNTVPFGDNVFGVSVAAKHYFNTNVSKLTIDQAAMLVGMLKANTYYNPIKHPERAKKRRNTVLKRLQKQDFITQVDLDSLVQLDIIVEPVYESANQGTAPYFRTSLKKKVKSILKKIEEDGGKKYNIYTDGLKIYTTLDFKMQTIAEKAVKAHMTTLQKEFYQHWKGNEFWKKQKYLNKYIKKSKRYKTLKNQGYDLKKILENFNQVTTSTVFYQSGEEKVKITPLDSIANYVSTLNTGVFAMNPKSGAVKIWVGGVNQKYFQYDHTLAQRSVGSTFKPFVYLAALEGGILPCEYFDNHLIIYSDYEDWTPENAGGKYGGVYSLKGGLAKSVNTIAVQTLFKTGIDKVIQVVHRLGIDSTEIPKVPSIALGTANLNLQEMVGAYSSLSNYGQRVIPQIITKIENEDGAIIYEAPVPEPMENTFEKEDIQLLTKMMQQVVENGTARKLRTIYGLKGDIAGKTGTTQNQSDGWFIGFTPNLVAGVWTGGRTPDIRFNSLAFGSGSHMALPIWGQIFKKLQGQPKYSNMVNASFEPLSDSLNLLLDCPIFSEIRPENIEGKMDSVLFVPVDRDPFDRLRKRREKVGDSRDPNKKYKSKSQNERKRKAVKKKKRKEKRKKFFRRMFGD